MENKITIKEEEDSIAREDAILRLKKEILSKFDKKLEESLKNYVKEHFLVTNE